MLRRSLAVTCALALLATGLVTMWAPVDVAAASKKAKKPLTKLQHDPAAEEVDLFEAIEAGQVTAKLIPKNAFGGNFLVENLTDKPLTVKLPQAAAAVPKHLAQFGGGMGGMQGGGMGGMGGMGGGMGGGGGQQQMGGGFGGGGMGGGMGGMGGGGGGFFGGGGGGFGSIPPESVASFKFNSVCLEHGKAEPTSRAEYVVVPLEKVSNSPVLRELLTAVGTGRLDQQSAQAAAWHITDDMSFADLANKQMQHAGGVAPTPYFSQAQLFGAQNLLAAARTRAEEAGEDVNQPPVVAPRGNIRASRTSASVR